MRYIAVLALCLTGCAPYYAGVHSSAGSIGSMFGIEVGRTAVGMLNDSTNPTRFYGSAELATGVSNSEYDAPFYCGVNFGVISGRLGLGVSAGGIVTGTRTSGIYETKSLPVGGAEVRLFLTPSTSVSSGFQAVRGSTFGFSLGF
jgi:hypothetical protein